MSVPKEHTLREPALLVAFFFLLTLLFTYPIWTAPDTYLNELADVRFSAWALAWDARALLTDPLGVFNANIFYPNKDTLAFSESFVGPALLVAPVNWAGHPVLAYNVLFFASFVLTGIGMTLWIRQVTGSLAGGLVAGVIWTFAPAKFDHLPQLHMLSGQWIPFALLYCGKYVESGRGAHLWLMAVFAGLQFAFSIHYGLFLFPILAAYGCLLILLLPVAEARRSPRKLLRDGLVAALIVALLILPIAVPYVGVHEAYGFERDFREIVAFSAQPKGFFSGSVVNKTSHVRWLYENYRATESNFFPGALPLLLAVAALVLLGPRVMSGLRHRLATTDPLRRRLVAAAAVVTATMLAFHAISLLLAQWWTRPAFLEPVLAASRWVSPALWLAVAATLLVAALPRARSGSPEERRGVYLLVTAYLALLTYLLAYGPIVRGWNFEVGYGPYWLLYQGAWPYQGLRAVGRFGLLWVLFVAALAGLGFAALSRGRRRATAAIALAVVVAVTVWEFRVWPLPHEITDPGQDPADHWLATQEGDFGVVHVPLQAGRQPWRETQYMLGSTLHWKRLVNGYSGFFPGDYVDLVAAAPLGPEFFRILREEFPVRYMVVHDDWLANEAQHARLRRLLGPNDDAGLVYRSGHSYVFTVPRDRESGAGVRRRYAAEQLEGKQGVRFLIRAPEDESHDGVVVTAGWGDQIEIIEPGETWQGGRLPFPGGFVAGLNGSPGAFEVRAHALVPLGQTGALIAAGVTLDVQDDGSGLGIDNRWLHQSDAPGYHVHVIEGFGAVTPATTFFPPTGAGGLDLLDRVAGLAAGTVVAVTIGLDDWRPLDDAVAEALRLIGGNPPVGEELAKIVVLGQRGAEPGQALQHVHHKWAVLDIEGSSPTIELLGISLYE